MNYRKTIIKMLQNMDEGSFLNEIMKSQDIPLIRDAVLYNVYGVAENLLYIDYIIEKYSDRKVKNMDVFVRNTLRLSVFQLFFSDSYPAYSIYDALNDLLPKKKRAYVHAVLKAMERDQEKALSIEFTGNKYYAIKYSVNMEIIELLKNEYQNKTVKKILESFFDHPKVCVRLTAEDALIKLQNEGFQLAAVKQLHQAYFVENPKGLFKSQAFKEGLFAVQDPSSILCDLIANPQNDMRVLDLCAAPGGKTAHMSQMMNNTGLIIANELYPNRNRQMKENFDRLKIENVRIMNRDATVRYSDWTQQFDLVLLDAPCSGIGMAHKKPEIKWRRTKADIDDLQKIQLKMIENAIEYLKPEGRLLYSTCTILRKENEEVASTADAFLTPMDIDYFGTRERYIKKMPYDNGYGGFFIAQWHK